MEKGKKRNLNEILEQKMLPIAAKLGSNKVLIAIRDGVTLSMPLIIIGSLFLIMASLPIDAWTNWLTKIGVDGYLWKGVDSSFGLMGLVASFGVANSYARQHKLDGVSVGIIALSSFIVVTPFGEGGIPVGYMGSKGLFVAMIIGIISTLIFKWFIDRNIQIKLPDSVPPAVSKSFSSLIPGAVIITLWLVVFGILDKAGIGNVHDLIAKILGGPLGLIGNNIFGTLIAILLNSLFWFLGIHGGNVVNSILNPVWLMNSDANRLIFQADKLAELPNIITMQFIDNYVFMGGGGATIGLVIVIALIARKKKASQITKTMAPLTLTPGLFNINEPAMFGIPVVMNISLLIPFILAPMANALITYGAMKAGFVALTTGISVSWTMPPILSGFLTTGGHISGAVIQIICIIVDVLIYWLFYQSVEKQNLILESEEIETNNFNNIVG